MSAQCVWARVGIATHFTDNSQAKVGRDMSSVPIPAEVVAAEMALVRQPETIQPQVCGALHAVSEAQVGEEVVQVGEAFAAWGDAHEPHALKHILVCFRDRPTKLCQLYK